MIQEKLDTGYLVETPEAIELSARLAGPVPRVLAYAMDFAIRTIVLLVIGLAFAFLGNTGLAVILLISFFIEWLYPVIFEVLRNGQTPGKKALGLAVVNDDLTPVTWSTSLVRNLLRAADFLPVGYAFGLVCMISNSRFQRLGDLAAGSLVIYRQAADKRAADLPDVPSQTPPLILDLEDQVAFTGFAQRHKQLSESRKEELATILQPLTQKSGGAAVRYVQGVGAWLLGRRQ